MYADAALYLLCALLGKLQLAHPKLAVTASGF